MTSYDLNGLGAQQFEQVVQALLKRLIGSGTVTFGAGKDGAREATFSGAASYPSASDGWSGEWIFQAKFHDLSLMTPEQARSRVLVDLEAEIDKTINKYGRRCDNFVLATNVPLTSVHQRGTIDRIESEIAAKWRHKIANVRVWGYDELNRFIDADASVRSAYLHLLTPGDLLAALAGQMGLTEGARTLQLYLSRELRDERYASLDQAGDVTDEHLLLQKVFIDVDVAEWQGGRSGRVKRTAARVTSARLKGGGVTRAVPLILSDDVLNLVFIGGPGQGKSTLGQFVAQIHRGTLLGKLSEVIGDDEAFVPRVTRVPFRVVLREFAQWVSESSDEDGQRPTLDRYVAQRVTVLAAAGVDYSVVHLHDLLASDPVLLIVDGLDEVVDPELRRTVTAQVEDFIDRARTVLKSDLQVIGTSRPNSYGNEFDPEIFLHLEVQKLDQGRAIEYSERWIVARELERSRAGKLRETFRESVEDANVEALIGTPLQVNIILYVILSGGRPARQRESLFYDYVEVIYRRERAKHKSIIKTPKDSLIGLHEYLGYLVHHRAGDASHASSDLSEDDFRREVGTYLRHQNPFQPEVELLAEVETLVTEARDRLVLLVEGTSGNFGFELRSLQEYFAAAHLVRTATGTDERAARFAEVATSPHWRNVALFFAGQVGRNFSGEGDFVLTACQAIDREPPDAILRRGATVARELAVDRVFGSSERLQQGLVDYAAAAVETERGGPFGYSATEGFHDLDRADRQRHLQPALVRRAMPLTPWHQRRAASWCAALGLSVGGLESELLRQIREEGPAEASEALGVAIDSDIEPPAIAAAFGAAAASLDPPSLANALVTKVLSDPIRMSACLEAVDMSEPQLIALADRVVNTAYFGDLDRYETIEMSALPNVADLSAVQRTVLTLGALTSIMNRRTLLTVTSSTQGVDFGPYVQQVLSWAEDALELTTGPKAVTSMIGVLLEMCSTTPGADRPVRWERMIDIWADAGAGIPLTDPFCLQCVTSDRSAEALVMVALLHGRPDMARTAYRTFLETDTGADDVQWAKSFRRHLACLSDLPQSAIAGVRCGLAAARDLTDKLAEDAGWSSEVPAWLFVDVDQRGGKTPVLSSDSGAEDQDSTAGLLRLAQETWALDPVAASKSVSNAVRSLDAMGWIGAREGMDAALALLETVGKAPNAGYVAADAVFSLVVAYLRAEGADIERAVRATSAALRVWKDADGEVWYGYNDVSIAGVIRALLNWGSTAHRRELVAPLIEALARGLRNYQYRRVRGGAISADLLRPFLSDACLAVRRAGFAALPLLGGSDFVELTDPILGMPARLGIDGNDAILDLVLRLGASPPSNEARRLSLEISQGLSGVPAGAFRNGLLAYLASVAGALPSLEENEPVLGLPLRG